MQTILLASNNEHKYVEMTGIFAALDAGVELLQPKELGFSFDVVEEGLTFADNSIAKARGLYSLLNGAAPPGVTASIPPEEIRAIIQHRWPQGPPPVLADDSGICVHALNNAPGVLSARFGSDRPDPPENDGDRNALLLTVLRDQTDRSAHYVCNAVLILDDERYLQAEATWHGSILREEIPGDTGFGYDPLVYLDRYETSVSRIPQAQKDRISHRAQAVTMLARGAGIV
ncbi:MAG: non-canonical purine NTP pyrophosphatase [Alkalispirochaeta sp.]